MDQLKRSYRSPVEKGSVTPTSFDSFSNVVAYDTEFKAPVLSDTSGENVDLEGTMRTLIKDAYSDRSAQRRTESTALGDEGQNPQEMNSHKGQDLQEMTSHEAWSHFQPTESRPSPTGACSDEDVSAVAAIEVGKLQNSPVITTREAKEGITVIGVHAKHRSRPSSSRLHTTKVTPYVEGDMGQNPMLIRVKSPEILREQKHVPKTTQQGAQNNATFNVSTLHVQRRDSDDEHGSNYEEEPRGLTQAFSGEENLSKLNNFDELDSGVHSPETDQFLSDSLSNARPLQASTPLRREGIAAVPPLRLALTSAEGRSRSSSELSQSAAASQHPGSGNAVHVDMMKIMQERAHLEGQVEMITKEANAALEEKARLHSMVLSLQSELASKPRSGEVEAFNYDAKDVTHLQMHIAELEDAIQEKATKSSQLADELESAKNKNKMLVEELSHVQRELSDHDGYVASLKKQVAQLQSQVQLSLKVKSELEAEIQSVRGDHEALVNAKNWYQNQLQFAQEARVQLQNELTVLQSKTVQQATLIEQLKTQNSQASHDLKYSHQMALQEKEQLARHLEVIEADMVQREVGFERIRSEQLQAEEILQEKICQVNEEKKNLSGLVSKLAEVEAELEEKTQLLKAKQDLVEQMEFSVKEMSQRLQETERVAAARHREIEELKENYFQTNTNLSQAVLQTSNKEETIKQLKNEKKYLETALREAVIEKNEYDAAIQVLKGDMQVIEANFRQMKQDLSAKTKELEDLKMENSAINGVVNELQGQLKTQQAEFEEQTLSVRGRNEMVVEMERQKTELEHELTSLRKELVRVQEAHQLVMEERQNLEELLIIAKKHSKDVETDLQNALQEKAHLEGQLEFVHIEQSKMNQVTKENSDLKTRVSQLEARLSEDLSANSVKIAGLEREIQVCKSELKQKEKQGESSVAVLTKKLRETIEAKEACERSLKELQSNSEAVETVEAWKDKVQVVSSELELVRQQKVALELHIEKLSMSTSQDVSQYQQKIGQLETLVEELKNQDCRRLLELEREKGRLAGIQQSHLALKQHANVLEDAVGRREVLLAEVKSQFDRDMADRDRKEQELTRKLQHYEEQWQKERTSNKQVKQKLAVLQKEKSDLKNSVEDLQSQLNATLADATSRDEVDQLTNRLLSLESTSDQHRLDIEQGEAEKRRLSVEVENLRRALAESDDRHSMFVDQVESLKWLIEQKSREVDSFDNQLRLSEDRHEVEINNFNKALKTAHQELEALKLELSAARKSKYVYQAKLAELRNAMKHKVKTQHSNSQLDSQTENDRFVEIERILQSESGPLFYSSQPLERLRTCLAGLRGEMTGLEEKIAKHAVGLESSSASWRRVEGMVQSVREACDVNPSEVKKTGLDHAETGQTTGTPVLDV